MNECIYAVDKAVLSSFQEMLTVLCQDVINTFNVCYFVVQALNAQVRPSRVIYGFLARNSSQSAPYAVARPSVRPSLIPAHQSKMAEVTITQFSSYSIPSL